MKIVLNKISTILLISILWTSLATTGALTMGGGMGCNGSGDGTDEELESGGGDGTEQPGQGAEDKDLSLIADALARVAIVSAFRIGLGIPVDDELLNPAHVQKPTECAYEYCPCGDGWCKNGETPTSCPLDCADICTTNCECGDGICDEEERYTLSCLADCEAQYIALFGNTLEIPNLHGVPTQKCIVSPWFSGGIMYRVEDSEGEASSQLSGNGLCGYGYERTDLSMASPQSLHVDFELSFFDLPLNGFTFTCIERSSDDICMEGSADIIIHPDGTGEFYTALSGIVHALRPDDPSTDTSEAKAISIVGASSSGRITLPPSDPEKMCVGGACTDFAYGAPSLNYELDGDGEKDAVISYLGPNDEILTSDQSKEICQSFLIDSTLVGQSPYFGPDNPPTFLDDDEQQGAACDDSTCAAHPFCTISPCDDEAKKLNFNFHAFAPHPACPMCGDGSCDIDSGEDISTCEDDCYCGNNTCDPGEFVSTCPQDCIICGDHSCDAGETFQDCPLDCDTCGNGFCGTDEGIDFEGSYCAEDCCPTAIGNGTCEPYEQATGMCFIDCCGNGTCDPGESPLRCPIDCPI